MDFQTFYQTLINCLDNDIAETIKKDLSVDEINSIINSKEFVDSFSDVNFLKNDSSKNVIILNSIIDIYLKDISRESLYILKTYVANVVRRINTVETDRFFNKVNYEFNLREAKNKPNKKLVILDKKTNKLVVKECIYQNNFAQILGYKLRFSQQVARYMENLFLEVGLPKFDETTDLENEGIQKTCLEELSKFGHYKEPKEVKMVNRYYSIESCLEFINSHIVNQDTDPCGGPYTKLENLEFISSNEASYILGSKRASHNTHINDILNAKTYFKGGYSRSKNRYDTSFSVEDIFNPQFVKIKNISEDVSYDLRPTIIIERDSLLRYFCLRQGSTKVTPELINKFEDLRTNFKTVN